MMRIGRRRTPALIAIFLLAGCAGQHVELTAEDQQALATEARIHAVHRGPNVGFHIESTGRTAVGVLVSPLVVLANFSDGAALVEELRLEDPVAHVKQELAGAFRASFKAVDIRDVPTPYQGAGIDSYVDAFGTGAVLEVTTAEWGLDNNRVKYAAEARLIKLEQATVLWHARCDKVLVGKDRPAPTLEELRAHEAQRLRADILEAAATCARQLGAWLVKPASASRTCSRSQPTAGGNVLFQSQGPGGPERGVYQNPIECGGRPCR